MIRSLILLTAANVDAQSTHYQLVDEYNGNNFFNQFDFRGSINETEARATGLINNTNTSVYIGTDYENIIWPRPSIYLYGKHTYSTGLVIIDLDHMPQGCATWPAFWMPGPDWPNNGEIDIIEGVNLYTSDQSSLHTGPNCSFQTIANNTNSDYNQTGTWMSTNCTTFIAKNNSFYGGCSINASNSQTYGVGLNKNIGGVFAMELNDNIGVRIWFWLHRNVPNDIIQKKPNPKLWSTPYSFWPFGNWCKSSNFKDLQIVFDLNYCGWAQRSETWGIQCQDIAKNQNCTEFVKNNPSYFVDAYWSVNYVDVYQLFS